ncbi:MAG: SGNH/GDSL hydrolase family protein [Anaerolineae bacterium]|nr:SGNH/GDSL hydrolase family protein [Anaerolineae bacterium]
MIKNSQTSDFIEDNAIVLFQGDSITDAGHSRSNDDDLGHGYAAMVAAWFSAMYPEKHVRFLNRGISGNRVKDLRARWQVDCLDLHPTWVSILIGVNDTWRRYDSHDPTSTEAYERDYRAILEVVHDTLGARLIVMEPFLLPIPADREGWRVDLDPKIAVARKLAREFDALFVPLDGPFAAAATRREMEFWLPDGVHPTPAGHAFIAQAWLRSVGAL